MSEVPRVELTTPSTSALDPPKTQPSSSHDVPTPEPWSSLPALHHLSQTLSAITLEDIKTAERCGGGGFGDVYLLIHPVVGKVALKRLRVSGNKEQVEQQIRRAARESETWRRLKHPNVLPFLDMLQRGKDFYLISPFVKNGSLGDYVQRNPDLDRTRLIQETASGISFLHRSGVIHGDIKAANVLVSDDVRALLCDFGLARAQQDATSIGLQGIGTVRWQSPELLMVGEGKTFKSDIWAFGMTIYEVLSGNFPYYEHATIPAVITALIVRKERPPQLPASSPTGTSYSPLWDVAVNCWHEDPDQRLTIEEVHDRLVLGAFRSLAFSPASVILPSSSRSTEQPNGHTNPTHVIPTAEQRPQVGVPLVRPRNIPSASSSREATIVGQTPSLNRLFTRIKHRIGLTTASITKAVRGTMLTGRKDVEVPTINTSIIRCLAFSEDGRTLASGSGSEQVRAWDVKVGTQKQKAVEGRPGSVSCLTFSPDFKTVASGSAKETIRLWDVESGTEPRKPLMGHMNLVRCIAFSPNGGTLASASYDDTIRFWDVESGEQKSIESSKGHAEWVDCLTWSPDGKLLATGSRDQTIRIWDIDSAVPRGEAFKGHSDWVNSLAFSPNGKNIASASSDRSVRLWDVESGVQIGDALEGHKAPVNCVVFSPDGKIITSASDDRTVGVWDAETGALRGTLLEGHTSPVRYVTFAPDGKTVASASEDDTVRMWDIGAGLAVGDALTSQTANVKCVAFTSERRVASSGSYDFTVRLWHL